MDKQNTIDINLTDAKSKIELASVQDADLMKIRAYAVTEGKNLNGTIFPRKILFLSYRTLVDKPVIIVPNKNDLPTGHAFNMKTGTFDISKRKNIGHIVDAYPVLVDSNGEIIEVYSVEDLDKYPECELRIMVDMVIYKNYFAEMSEKLELLHNSGGLSFSMESVIKAIKTEDNGKVATNISFTGLAIVDTPAFVNSKSIEVAEKEENKTMDYEKAYKELLEKYNALKAQVDGQNKEKKEKENAELNDQLTSTKEELATTKTELAEANATIESLKPFKEQVENAEKQKLGEERATKLKKLNVEKDATELAEMTKEAFADVLIEAAENFKPVVETASKKEDVSANFHESKLNNDLKSVLSDALENLM